MRMIINENDCENDYENDGSPCSNLVSWASTIVKIVMMRIIVRMILTMIIRMILRMIEDEDCKVKIVLLRSLLSLTVNFAWTLIHLTLSWLNAELHNCSSYANTIAM